jgi:hypothetical protein
MINIGVDLVVKAPAEEHFPTGLAMYDHAVEVLHALLCAPAGHRNVDFKSGGHKRPP